MYRYFKCVGGPANGQAHTHLTVPPDYIMYNRNHQDKTIVSAVFIHESIAKKEIKGS